MTRIGEHLVERVLPVTPVRQWVLTVPHRLRYRMAYDHAVCSRVLQAFSKSLLGSYRRRALDLGIRGSQTGAITFIQRFGSALNLNIHFHTQALDGVFTETKGGALLFHALPAPSDSDVRSMLEEVTVRVQALLRELDDDTSHPNATPLMAACYAGSVTQRTALGPRAGLRPPRLGASADLEWTERRRAAHAELEGFDLHASVHVPAHARARLEQLLRYCARPPVSHDRLEPFDSERLRLALKPRGTTAPPTSC